ncbi:hypothetical protein CBS101457_003132 [Exobasidium rhododendri]|nr:hypothetical protein CBS101457_003132 [Exobasidium rhododendri]
MSNSHPTEASPPDSRVFVFHHASKEKEDHTRSTQVDKVAESYYNVESTHASTDSSADKFMTQAADKTLAGNGNANNMVVVTLPDELAGQDVHDKTAQSIYLPNDDLILSLRFYHRTTATRVSWYLSCILSVSILYIAAYWYPRIWLRWNCSLTTLEESKLRRGGQTWIAVKTRHDPLQMCRVKRQKLPTPTSASFLFPPSMKIPATAPGEQSTDITEDKSTPAEINNFFQFDYRSTVFLLHPTGSFIPLGDWRDPEWTSTSMLLGGLQPSKHLLLESLFGPNLIDVKGRSIGTILLNEVLHPFYIFMIYSIILWGNDDYLPYAIVIMVISIIGITSTTVETQRSVTRLRNMSRFVCKMEIWTQDDTGKGEWLVKDSTHLVPGDIINVAASGEGKIDILACDCVMLEGDAIVSEAMLTGESVPVVKSAIANSGLNLLHSPTNVSKLDRHFLFGGTRLIRARMQEKSLDGAVRAMVVKTGFNTSKGSLIRQMLFPRVIKFKFLKDAFTAIGILFLLAFIGMIASIIYFVHIGVDPEEIALRSLDVLTIAVPPALPAALSVATTFAIARLKRRKIFCTSPQRINVAGMITAVVFDKTGTLTEEGLSVLGVCEVSDQRSFKEATKSYEQMEKSEVKVNLREALATTHDLNTFEGKLLGEPLEGAMFAWTEAGLHEDEVAMHLGNEEGPALTSDGKQFTVPIVAIAGSRVAVVKKFDFSSNLRRMSVIVKGEHDTGAQVYVKGAPEVIGSLCHRDTFPMHYEESLDHWTRGGFRVIALAGKRWEDQRWETIQSKPREEIESDLTFLGLLIFENRLKEGSKDTIRLLNEGSIITKMCTGDAPLTAIAVAKESGLVADNKPVYMARVVADRDSDADVNEKSSGDDEEKEKISGGTGRGLVEWVDIADTNSTLDSYSLQPLRPNLLLTEIGLCISGETYSFAIQHCALETLERLLVSCQVFARFSPEQKQDLVERLQSLDYSVAFAGDGANDMGGLKSADVGLSLSQAEASVAAPFTSLDIRAMEELCREGRNAVTTSCNLFNFMIIYSLCEYFSVLMLYGAPSFSTSFTNADYLYIDIFLVFPFAIGMSASLPARKLANRAAHARIISRRNLVSIMNQFVLLVLAQLVIYLVLHQQEYYEPPQNDPDNLDLNTQDNTALFKTSIFTYVYAAIIWNFGPPHRQILPRNYLLTLAITVLTTLNFYFLFCTGGPLYDLFGFQGTVKKSFFWIIFGVIVAQFVFALGFELFGVDLVAQWLKKPTRAMQRIYWEKLQKKPFLNNEKRHRLVSKAIKRGLEVGQGRKEER